MAYCRLPGHDHRIRIGLDTLYAAVQIGQRTGTLDQARQRRGALQGRWNWRSFQSTRASRERRRRWKHDLCAREWPIRSSRNLVAWQEANHQGGSWLPPAVRLYPDTKGSLLGAALPRR